MTNLSSTQLVAISGVDLDHILIVLFIWGVCKQNGAYRSCYGTGGPHLTDTIVTVVVTGFGLWKIETISIFEDTVVTTHSMTDFFANISGTTNLSITLGYATIGEGEISLYDEVITLTVTLREDVTDGIMIQLRISTDKQSPFGVRVTSVVTEHEYVDILLFAVQLIAPVRLQ